VAAARANAHAAYGDATCGACEMAACAAGQEGVAAVAAQAPEWTGVRPALWQAR